MEINNSADWQSKGQVGRSVDTHTMVDDDDEYFAEGREVEKLIENSLSP
jgi:hypothetical protein